MSSDASPVDAGDLSHAEEQTALRGAPVRIAAVSLFVTACLLVLKLTLGLLSGSIAVLSDAVDSGTDLVGGAAALFSIQISRRPEARSTRTATARSRQSRRRWRRRSSAWVAGS